MSIDTILETIQQRRTIRRYTDEDVTDDQVKGLLLAGMSAPSFLNRRPWHFVIIRDPVTKELISEQYRLNPGLKSAPVFIGVLADTTKSPTWRIDLSGAVENILLAGTAMGLGTAWISAANTRLIDENNNQLDQRLGIPDHFQLLAFVAVGNAAEERPPHETDSYFASTRIHYDTWNNRKIGARDNKEHQS